MVYSGKRCFFICSCFIVCFFLQDGQAKDCLHSDQLRLLKGNIDQTNCGYGAKNAACYPGFYKSETNPMEKCDEGYFCPPNFICKIKCREGSYCPASNLKNDLCEPYDYQPYRRNVSEGICGGASSHSLCPGGQYCETPLVKQNCPKNYYCINGTSSPSKCWLLSYCPMNTLWPTSWGFIIITLTSIFVLPVLGLKLYYVYRNQFRVKRDIKMEALRESVISNLHGGGGVESSSNFKTCAIYDLLQSDSLENGEKKLNKYKINIQFNNLGLEVTSSGKQVLENVSGRLQSGKLTAIMGPSGCGKSSLLNALAGKAHYGRISGNIYVNGSLIKDMKNLESLIGFVPQDDVMHRNLTVRETLTFFAFLRLPASDSKESKAVIVEHVMKTLGLYDVRHSRIGDEETRGISGGQRKRVNIGIELVANPSLLFLDEPTSGLDSTCSLEVVETLKRIAQHDVNVVTVIHQPRTEVFELFDDVVLLVDGGRSVYVDQANSAITHFEHLGYDYPLRMNPADFLMDVISGKGNRKGAPPLSPMEFYRQWDNIYQENHELYMLEASTHRQVYSPRELPQFWDQFVWITVRSFVQQFRSPMSQLLHFGLVTVAGLGMGLLFHTRTLEDTSTIGLLISMTIGMTTLQSSLQHLGQDKVVYYREAATGMNSFAYFLAKNVAGAYIQIISPIFFLSTFYGLVTPQVSFGTLYAILYIGSVTCNSIGMFVSVIFSEKNSQLAGIVIILLNSMFAGTNPTICSLNSMGFIPFLGVSISYARYMTTSLVVSEIDAWPDAYYFKVAAIKKHYCYEEFDLEWNLIILIVISVVLRGLAFLALVTVVPNPTQSLKNLGKQSIWIGMGLAISAIVCGTIIGIAYLLVNKS